MSKNKEDLQREMVEHSANALRLFDEAKQIQRQLSALPFFKRRHAMDKVNALEQKAVEESLKSIALENEIAVAKRENI